jgi:hypothetical protein
MAAAAAVVGCVSILRVVHGGVVVVVVGYAGVAARSVVIAVTFAGMA